MPRAPVAQEIRDEIAAALRAQPEASLAEIGRQFGFSPTFVRAIARANGLRPDRRDPAARELTQKAHRAALDDMAARRARLSQELLGHAERLVRSLTEPHVAFNFGGKDNTYNEREMPRPDTTATRTILTSVGIALDKHAMLLRLDAGHEVDDAASLLGKLGDSLSMAFGDGSAHRTATPEPEA